MPRIYLDFNASTPIAPEAAAAMRPLLEEGFGNPSSAHWAGDSARRVVEQARLQVASLLGCERQEVIFTSGGTESNNHALKGVFPALQARGRHLITTSVEHPAVLQPCAFLRALGAEVTVVPVDGTGRVDPDAVRRAIRPDTTLISVMHANNEVGTLQPVPEIARIAREHGVLMHTDAAQSAGKLPTRVAQLGVDLLSVAGHKLYAPKGVGALFVRQGVRLEPLLHGAGHEGGRRAGTENVPHLAGFGAACALAETDLGMPTVRRLRDLFFELLRAEFGDGVVLNGHPLERLPNTLNVSFRGQVGAVLLSRMKDVAASTGAACHSDEVESSPVLKAMGVPPEIAAGAIRFSLGRTTTEAEIHQVVDGLRRAVGPRGR